MGTYSLRVLLDLGRHYLFERWEKCYNFRRVEYNAQQI